MQDMKSTHKYLQFLRWNTNIWLNDIDVPNETFNLCIIYGDNKIFGPGDGGVSVWTPNLIPFGNPDYNVRRVEDNWFFNKFRDVWNGSTPIQDYEVYDLGPNPLSVTDTKEWFDKSRMRDKYLIVRLSYTGTGAEKIEFESLEFGVKPSFR
jgi:hypothetical protein